MATYYDILELIDTNVEGSDIKRAFRALALKHHPDKGGDEMKFKEISEAYDVLIDPVKRKNYDKKLQRGVSSKSLSTGTSNDVVEQSLTKDLKLKQLATGRYVVIHQGVIVRMAPDRAASIHPKELLMRGDFFEIQAILTEDKKEYLELVHGGWILASSGKRLLVAKVPTETENIANSIDSCHRIDEAQASSSGSNDNDTTDNSKHNSDGSATSYSSSSCSSSSCSSSSDNNNSSSSTYENNGENSSSSSSCCYGNNDEKSKNRPAIFNPFMINVNSINEYDICSGDIKSNERPLRAFIGGPPKDGTKKGNRTPSTESSSISTVSGTVSGTVSNNIIDATFAINTSVPFTTSFESLPSARASKISPISSSSMSTNQTNTSESSQITPTSLTSQKKSSDNVRKDLNKILVRAAVEGFGRNVKSPLRVSSPLSSTSTPLPETSAMSTETIRNEDNNNKIQDIGARSDAHTAKVRVGLFEACLWNARDIYFTE